MTNTIKTIIVDDEINSIHNLEEDLKAYPENLPPPLKSFAEKADHLFTKSQEKYYTIPA